MQPYFWADEEVQALRQKSLGAAIMVRDFIEEVGVTCDMKGRKQGFTLSPQEMDTSTTMTSLTQVEKAVSILEK